MIYRFLSNIKQFHSLLFSISHTLSLRHIFYNYSYHLLLHDLTALGLLFLFFFKNWTNRDAALSLHSHTPFWHTPSIPPALPHQLTAFNLSTCSSVLSVPNSARNSVEEWNWLGSRKFSKLNSSSTLFWSGVPDSKTLCSYRTNNTCIMKYWVCQVEWLL